MTGILLRAVEKKNFNQYLCAGRGIRLLRVVFVNDVDIVMRVHSGFNYLNDPPRVETRPGIFNNSR